MQRTNTISDTHFVSAIARGRVCIMERIGRIESLERAQGRRERGKPWHGPCRRYKRYFWRRRLGGVMLLGVGLWAIGVRGRFASGRLYRACGLCQRARRRTGHARPHSGCRCRRGHRCRPPDETRCFGDCSPAREGAIPRSGACRMPQVQIVSEGMIGAKIVEIIPGKEDAGPIEE